ncbi:MAG TPA: ATP-binding protein, partial [Ktedonobacterales bacterium]|nr:ATP-binding protein [Ktedonobacterales bacterium]
ITYDTFQRALDTQVPVLVLDTEKLQTSGQRSGMPWPARSLICVPLLQPVEDDAAPGASSARGSAQAAPMVEPMGVLAVASPHPSEFSEADKEVLTLFAQTIINGMRSVALLGERAELMREVRHDFLRALPPLTVYMDTLEEPLEAALAAPTLSDAHTEIQTVKELTDKINALVFLVADLTNWFFDLSNDQLEPESDPAKVVTASSIIEILKRPIGELARAYKRSVDWEMPRVPISVAGGEIRERLIRAVLFKYLDNAIKYGEEDVVSVTLAADGGFATFGVRSVGRPIPQAERGRIFLLNYRGSNAGAGQPGSGIGLFQAREIAQALGGRVGYEAVPPHFNVFTLSLPLAGS